jgi:DNA-binding Xre family transcriptional regulator
MPLIWKLKRVMVLQKDWHRASDLQAALAKCGLRMSLTSCCALVNKTPEALRVPTLEALCKALNCRLSDFCQIEPDDPQDDGKLIKVNPQQGNGSSSGSGDIGFPDPYLFSLDDDD